MVYTDGNKVRSLVPVREYIQKFLPPSQSLVQTLEKHFYALLELYQKFNGDMLQPVINQITSNLGNLQEVLHRGLYASSSDASNAIHCILSLSSFYRVTGRGCTTLMDHIQPILRGLDDHLLKIHFIIELLKSYRIHSAFDPQQLITEAVTYFKQVDNPLLECEFFCYLFSS